MDSLAVRRPIERALAPEEAARGDFYALLARLFHHAPDRALLGVLASAKLLPPQGNRALAQAWRELVQASGAMDAEAAAEEYEAIFIGVGKAQVSIYAGYYTGAPAMDHPRVRLQAALAALGLARLDKVTEPEDHFAVLFEAMRVFVAGGAGRASATLAEQRSFFEEHLGPGAGKFFAAIERAAQANYYRKVAAFGAAFISLEAESFVLD